jgi:hypothetical protein
VDHASMLSRTAAVTDDFLTIFCSSMLPANICTRFPAEVAKVLAKPLLDVSNINYLPSNGRADSNCIQQHSGITS